MIILVILVVAIIVGIIVGIILSGVMAPIIIAANRKKLRTMREVVAHYNTNLMQDVGDREEAYKRTLKILYALKIKVTSFDKASFAEANDIIQEFKDLN